MAKLKAKVDKKKNGKEKEKGELIEATNTDGDTGEENTSDDHAVGKKGGRGKKVVETEVASSETEVKKENADETEENTADEDDDDEPAVVNGSAKTHGGSKTVANSEESSDANEAAKGRKRTAKSPAAKAKKSKTDSQDAAEDDASQEPESEDANVDDKAEAVNSTPNKRGRQSARKATPKQKKETKEDEDYEVEDILEVRTDEMGNKEFLVKWKGYKKSDSTWEPEDHLSCKDLIEGFYKKTEVDASPAAGKTRTSKSTASKANKKKTEEQSKQSSRAVSKSSHSKSVQKSSKGQNKSENKEYEVANILEMRTDETGNKEFLVNWKGYKKSDSTWEPEKHLSCKDLIEAFYKKTESTAATPTVGKKRASQSPAPKAKKTKGSPKATAAAKRRTKKK